MLRGTADNRIVTIGGFRFAPGDAADLLELRKSAIKQSRMMALVPMDSRILPGMLRQGPPKPALAKRLPGMNVHQVVAGASKSYVETWVTSDSLALVVAIFGKAVPAKQLATAIQVGFDQLNEDPPAEVHPEPLRAWLREVRAIEPPSTTSPAYRTHRAAVALGTRRADTACEDAFGDALSPGAVPDVAPYAALAYRCAALRGEEALAARTRGFAASLPLHVVEYRVTHLLETDRFAAALEVLALAEDVEAPALMGLRVAAFVGLGRWSQVEELAQRQDVDDLVRAWAAATLFVAGRHTVADAIFSDVCTAFDDPAMAEFCTER